MDPSCTSGRAGSEELSAVSTLPASIDGRKDRQLDALFGSSAKAFDVVFARFTLPELINY